MKIDKKNIILGLLLIIIVWASSGGLIYFCFDINERGLIGDMFGAINALFSGLALFGIILSIFIQQKELKLQQLELSNTREEFKINRLTNILFNQASYINTMINDTNFKSSASSKGTMSINELIFFLDSMKEKNHNDVVEDMIKRNDSIIVRLITNIYWLLNNFERLLEKSKLEISENNNLKLLLSNNIDLLFLSLMDYKSNYLKTPASKDPEIAAIEKTVLSLEIERITYIIRYGKKID